MTQLEMFPVAIQLSPEAFALAVSDLYAACDALAEEEPETERSRLRLGAFLDGDAWVPPHSELAVLAMRVWRDGAAADLKHAWAIVRATFGVGE